MAFSSSFIRVPEISSLLLQWLVWYKLMLRRFIGLPGKGRRQSARLSGEPPVLPAAAAVAACKHTAHHTHISASDFKLTQSYVWNSLYKTTSMINKHLLNNTNHLCRYKLFVGQEMQNTLWHNNKQEDVREQQGEEHNVHLSRMRTFTSISCRQAVNTIFISPASAGDISGSVQVHWHWSNSSSTTKAVLIHLSLTLHVLAGTHTETWEFIRCEKNLHTQAVLNATGWKNVYVKGFRNEIFRCCKSFGSLQLTSKKKVQNGLSYCCRLFNVISIKKQRVGYLFNSKLGLACGGTDSCSVLILPHWFFSSSVFCWCPCHFW